MRAPSPHSTTTVCASHGLRYNPAVASGCIRCPGATAPSTPKVRPGFLATLAVFLVALAIAAGPFLPPAALSALSPATAASSSTPASRTAKQLRTTNSAGRSGSYYIPSLSPAARAAPVALLVFLHGTGGNSDSGVQAFRALADERSFAILAPESRIASDGQANWEVGDHPGEVTDDRRHVMACLAELLAVLSTENLTLDPRHVLVAGHSGGASSAPWLATNEEPFTAFAVLHGGAFPSGFGRRHVRGWFSTGSRDPIRPPDMVTRAYEAARGPTSPYEMHVFAGGHEMGTEERQALITWWLGT